MTTSVTLRYLGEQANRSGELTLHRRPCCPQVCSCQHSPSFSPAGRAPGGRGTGLCVGVVPSRPRPGKEAVAGQKSSVFLSVWVLLSLLPVFTWEAAGAGTGAHDKEGRGGGSVGPGGCSWCSFPRSSPGNTPSAAISSSVRGTAPYSPRSYNPLLHTHPSRTLGQAHTPSHSHCTRHQMHSKMRGNSL